MAMGMLSRRRGKYTNKETDRQRRRKASVVKRGGTMKALAREMRMRLR
jgi:hypothetical protein